jgi:hypothetical protein
MKKKVIAVMFACLLCSALLGAQTPVLRDTRLHAALTYHREFRGNEQANGFDMIYGFDWLLLRSPFALYIGARVGLWEETLFFGYTIPAQYRQWELHYSGGIDLVGVVPFIGNSGLAVGAAADLLIGDSYSPVYLYCSAKLGWRQFITKQFDMEVDLEPGLFPFFSPVVIFAKVNLQVGFHL